MTRTDRVRIQAEDFSLADEVQLLQDSSKRIGAIVPFLGIARDFSGTAEVKSIEFEEYKGMALKALKALREAALEKFDIIDLTIVHRVTTVGAGDNIVLIIAASEHRKAAFEACEWTIDKLKETVPIWKKEITPEGESWVTEHP
ncbi:MAG: molybdenum cofactor biosynthesis protein MoaE [Deltaproteobacteria bacterium]|nr:molybdenum cofactor biosynthesis protein MoaE [Deltaproteobacteria bacterium]